nr:hypothetical protein [uncultured Arsenicibacter sp.]
MIESVLRHSELVNQPPVLIDIGASGKLHGRWRLLAKHSICIAFDADDRDFGYVEQESKTFKKLYTFNNIVTDTDVKEADFYLTASPHCSSLLRPRPDLITEHAFAPKFEIEKVVKLKTRSLKSVLNELSVNQVDWIKIDSQGTDWRLFNNLGPEIQPNVLAAEFEPGITSVYDGEDKLYTLMHEMEKCGCFWLAELLPKGSPRITPALMDSFSTHPFLKKFVLFSLKDNAMWAEMTYLNTFQSGATQSKRNLLLGWVIATILKQHGFALILAEKGKNAYNDPVFGEMISHSRRQIWKRVLTIRFWPEIVKKVNLLFGK